MDRDKAERVFAQAVALPAGPDRDALVARGCDGDKDLDRWVRSLLRAHDHAGTFLHTTTGARLGGAGAPSTTVPPPSPAVSGAAAAHAWEFLLQPDGARPSLEGFLQGVSPEVQQETRQRIDAALQVRRHPVSAADHAHPEESPPDLPGFRIERRLAAGGVGVVYAAYDEKLRRRVAVKVLRQGATPAVRQRILDEARKAAALSDPAIVTVHAVLDEATPPAIVMELVEGYALDRFAERLNFAQKAALLREVARGLAAAHGHGLIHRDLKPANVLVGPDLRPRILDFGLALSLSEAERQGTGFAGTPLYASPEQVRDEPLTPASDVFSLGSLIFTVLTGRAPFQGNSVDEVLSAIATTAPPFLREVAVGVPEDLQAICLACLAWDPSDRPSAAAVALDLGRFLAGEPVRLRPKLYGDLLRRRLSEQAVDLVSWQEQGMVSPEERDQFATIHRRLLAEEDPWIIDARRLTTVQTILYASTWLVVVGAVLLAWLARDELAPLWRWLVPLLGTGSLLALGILAERRRESQASASFLAGAALALVPTVMSVLQEAGVLAGARPGVVQVFGSVFTNEQFLVSCAGALVLSATGLARLRLTGFAWTTAALGVATYLAFLTTRNFLDWPSHHQAISCLPLVLAEGAALAFEQAGRVRWSVPFQWVALLALAVSLDVIAADGPTLRLLGGSTGAWGGYLDHDRMEALSFAANGLVFLALALAAERAPSLDLRRASRLLEVLALTHTLSALFLNAHQHREDPWVRLDVTLYLAATGLFLILGPWRARWRLLVGGLVGLALGSYLLVDLDLVSRTPFAMTLIGIGLVGATATFTHLLRAPRAPRPLSPAPGAADSPGRSISGAS